MIIDFLLILPSVIIAQIWKLLEVAQPYPDGMYTASNTVGDFLARLDFIIPIDTLGTLVGWYFVAIIAYFVIWTVFVLIAIYQAVKLF